MYDQNQLRNYNEIYLFFYLYKNFIVGCKILCIFFLFELLKMINHLINNTRKYIYNNNIIHEIFLLVSFSVVFASIYQS